MRLCTGIQRMKSNKTDDPDFYPCTALRLTFIEVYMSRQLLDGHFSNVVETCSLR